MLVLFAGRIHDFGRKELIALLLRIDGIQSGPYEADEVERRYRDGDLGRYVMSWREGEDHWISLGKRWRGHERSMIAASCITIALLAVGGATAVSRSEIRILPFSLQTGTVLWLLVGVLIGITAAALFVAWRATAKASKRSLVLVVVTIVATVACALSLAAASVDDSVLRIRRKTPNAKVTFDKADNAIHITGILGARLNAQFQDALNRHPGTRMIVLDSPGGLVEDALGLADTVSSRRLPARIEGMCASACVAVWAASPYREMDATSVVGVHKMRVDINLPSEFIVKADAKDGSRYDAFLRNAGFDEATIRKGNQTPPSGMYWLNPAQVGAAGVTFVVVGRNGAPVSTPMATWLWVEHALGEHNSATALMAAIREDAPSLVSRHAEAMYGAWSTSTPRALNQAMESLSSDALVFALQHATDKATVRWAQSLYAVSRNYESSGSMCSLAYGEGAASHAIASALADASNHNLGQLVSTTTQLEVVHPLPASASPVVDAVLRRVEADAKRWGYPTRSHWTGREWCQYRLAYYGYALQLPTPQAAEAVRYFELHR